MSKKTPVKKSKRRLKRSVRRSLATALMITSLAVAAIPVPENYAEDGSSTVSGNGTTSSESTAEAYKYPTEKMYVTDEKGNPTKNAQYYSSFGLDLAKGSKKTYRTHYIADVNPDDEKNAGASFRMEWQYEYFLKDISDLGKGIICGYNDSYNVNTLVVSTNPIKDYYVVDKTIVQKGEDGTETTLTTHPVTGIITYDAFKAKESINPPAEGDTNSARPYEFKLSGKPDDEKDSEFKTYFPNDYERYARDYEQYEQNKASYETRLAAFNTAVSTKTTELLAEKNADGSPVHTMTELNGYTDEQWAKLTGVSKPSQAQEPAAVIKYPKDFPLDKDEYAWRLFYCQRNGLKGYILTKVADSEKLDDATGNTVYSYVPRRIDLSTIDTSEPGDDALGFKVEHKTAFLGIGDNAFRGVANVANIELPDALKYIGDNAFEGSFITSIKMMNLETIGNYAFKNCPRLAKVEMVQGVKYIGTEAFYGLSLVQEVVFPGEIEYIGPGAFANCAALSKIDFSAATLEVVIDDYAFYNDGALSEVIFTPTIFITTIGKCAFAVWDGVSGGLSEFVFPSRISQKRADPQKGYPDGYAKKGLGDYILAGRTNLKDVTMPAAYGMASEIELPGHIFKNCIALERVNFPDTGQSCGFVTFPEDFFASVSNPKFYVQGPPYTEPSNMDPALPRRSTWAAYSAAASIKNDKRVPNIPYVYYLNGIKYTEICDGEYLMCIDQNGMLISCSLHPDKTALPGTIDLIIPAEVAGTVVKGIASDCFAGDANEPDKRKMSKAVRTLTVMDGSELATINDNVFVNWENLERVYLGDSVRNVGNNVFQNCVSLVDVYFNTPEDVAAAGGFTMGNSSFLTNSAELTFHGPISTAYAPYQRAVLQNTVIDDNGRGKRICYKSLTPTYFTVIRDNGTGEPTLLDYPKYDQIVDILGESYAVRNGYYIDSFFNPKQYYKDYMESMYYSLYSATQYDAKRAAFKQAWIKAADTNVDDIYTDPELYGPWVNPDWIKMTDFTATSTGTTSSGTTQSSDAGSAIADFFFEPIIAQAASGKPVAYFAYENKAKGLNYGYDVYKNFERPASEAYGDYQRYTLEEYNLLNATRNVTVPDGVTSIDVKAFLNREPNSPNLSYIDRGKVGPNSYIMYNNDNIKSTLDYSREDVYAGLFSGDYADYADGTADKENTKKGNDRLESVDLNQVKSLPNYAFDSCENLKTVTIGAACTDIKSLPFRGCTSLTTLNVAEENPKYVADNRLLYARNTNEPGYDANNPTFTIVECLESRGLNNNNSVVTSAIDLIIPQVTKIADGAFEDCNNVSRINLSDATELTVVPERAFMNCDGLNEVDLPLSVNKIDKDAFKDDLIGRVQIPGREVFISTNAFNKVANKTQPTYIITYNDSSARRYADTYGKEYNLEWEDIGELWNVNFYDFDGTLIKAMQVKDGWSVKTSEVPEATRDGYKFLKWVGTNNVDVQDEITQDTDFIATYSSTSQMVDGKWVVDFLDGVTGEAFWPTQLVEDGEAATEPPFTPFHEGYKFLKYSKDFTSVTSNMSIVALYEVDGSGGGAGGNGTTSGSTTNTSGSTTNTSGSSSNTSGSSTSTTSSGETKTRHTVTVVNGYGSGSYAEGETVIIVANEPAEGQKFSQWRTESEGVELVMILASATTFVMPANNVLVTAEFTAGSSKPTTTPLSTPASGTVATNTGTTGNSGNNGNTRVDITKPGISNKNLATANVNGSTDNFIVKISETPEATQAVINALTNKYGNLDDILYYAMDISLYDSTGTTKITDTTGLSVDITIPIPDALVAYGGNNMMGAVVGNDQLEDMSERFTTIAGVPCISFTATHFSPYTIYVNTQNLSEGLLDITPKTGDPIHPKWFLSIGLAALSIILFMKKDKKTTVKTA